eukprot:2692395-Prorocentrum_lima.AAC.1
MIPGEVIVDMPPVGMLPPDPVRVGEEPTRQEASQEGAREADDKLAERLEKEEARGKRREVGGPDR